MNNLITYELITYEEYQQGIAPLRNLEAETYLEHLLINDPAGVIQYCGRELFEKIILLPIKANYDGQAAAYTCLFNVSDTVVRFNGIYTVPKFRGKGVGIGMCEWGLKQWPKPWCRLVGYYRDDNFLRFAGSWGLKEYPGFNWRVDRRRNGYTLSRVILAYKEFNE